MARPSVVVGVVTRNRAELVPRSLSSALAQRGCSVCVAAIDDNSTDRTPELIEQFPTVQWTRWSPGRGHMAARNHWMNSTEHDYFVSLDDDAWFLRGDEVALAVDVLERRPEIAAVAFDILSPDRPNPVTPGEPKATAMFIGCGHLIRLAAVRSVGVYEATPGSYGGEEKDLCLRLMDAGYQIVLLPGAHVWHDKTQVARVIPDQHRSGVCNDLVMTFRRTPSLLLPVALIVKLYRHWAFSRTHGLVRPCLQAFAWFARSLPVLWSSRRPIKAKTLRAFMRLAGARATG